MTYLRKFGSLGAVWIKSLATTACSFCSGSRSYRMNFARTHFMPRSCVKNLGHSSSWNPQISFYFLHCQSLIFGDCSSYTFNIPRFSACCRPSRMWTIFNTFLTTFEVLLPHIYLCCTHCIIPKSLLTHPNSFCRRMFKLNAKFDAHFLLYSLSHFWMWLPHSTYAHSTESTAPSD